MRKFRVTGAMTISVSVVVRARTKHGAIRKAASAPMMTFCHHCARGEDDAWSTSGELDGEPHELRAEPEDT